MEATAVLLRAFTQKKSPAGIGYQYLLSVPPRYSDDTTKRWPLILFLHGAGESARGSKSELLKVRKHGIPKLVTAYELLQTGKPAIVDVEESNKSKNNLRPRDPDDFASTPVPEECAKLASEEFITVSPQVNFINGYGWTPIILESLLDEVEAQYRVDKTRIYVTGVSMGGYGTWALAANNPDRFAAIAPICGGASPKIANLLVNVPIWNFHGELDDVIPISESEKIIKALKKAGSTKVLYTTYPKLKHDSWTESYNNIELLKWFLANKKCE